MNRRLKEQLRAAFDAPAPERKNAFLLSLNFPKTARLGFVLAQAGYIRKRIWLVTVLTAAPALFFLYSRVTENVMGFIWVMSSFIPFVVFAGVTEIARSLSYNMAELETTCKYSFPGVVLARMGILGCANTVMFAAVIISLRMAGSIPVPRITAYLLVPFLLTCSLSLFTVNRLRTRESVYICGVISCGVGVANAVLTSQYRAVFDGRHTVLWGAAFFILLLWTAAEAFKLIKGTEEEQWSLSLTA